MSKPPISTSHRFSQRHQKSQATLEFALAFPILLMIVFGIIDFSLLFAAWLSIQNMTRQAVRYASTGQYNITYCSDYNATNPSAACGNGKDNTMIDAARMKSIQDEANKFRYFIFFDKNHSDDNRTAWWVGQGYINLTICSSRDKNGDGVSDYVLNPSKQGGNAQSDYAQCTLNGTPTQDDGGPGDYVSVSVDFNHPFLTPFISYAWPYFHLASTREAIVERFRVSRVANVPPPIALPTNTPLPPTITPTPKPIYIEITNPAVDGAVITGPDETRFEATTYDPNVGITNGDGISDVHFWFTGPSSIPSQVEHVAPYCAFGDNGTVCNTITAKMSYSLAPGTYTIYAYADATSGQKSETVSKTFVVVATPTPTVTLTPTQTATPTETATPTITPTPNCARMSFTTANMGQGNYYGLPFAYIKISNRTGSSTYLTSLSFDWEYYDELDHKQAVDQLEFNNQIFGTTNYSSSPVNWNGAGPWINGRNTAVLDFYFKAQDNSWPGDVPSSWFGLTVSFSNGCSLTIVPRTPTVTPTPTITRTPTGTTTPMPTPTPTWTPNCNLSGAITTTNIIGSTQNINGYDCPYGCINSPYLKGAQDNKGQDLPPGTYQWIVQTVGNNPVTVNNGTFFLGVGQTLGPPDGVVVSLGQGMYNVPPGYFPGEFKVIVWQSGQSSCGQKSDNIKILFAAPSPTPSNTPTKTRVPTNTPKATITPTPTHPLPTSTPTPTRTPTITPTRTPICSDC